MLAIKIPSGAAYVLEHLVLDYNGTIAEDGEVLPDIVPMLNRLREHLEIHVLTADTHGTVEQKVVALPVRLHLVRGSEQDVKKCELIRELGREKVAAIGNGRNDVLMLTEAALGIAVMQAEGCFAGLIAHADVFCCSIRDALQLLLIPERLRATLRN